MPKVLLHDAKIFLCCLFLAVSFTFLDTYQLLNFPKSTIQLITTPIQFGVYKSSLMIFKQFEFIVLAGEALEQNKVLNEQLAVVLSDNANLRKQLAETNVLAAQQAATNAQNFNLLSARPIGVSRYLYIDKGSDDKVKKGQAVIYKDNLLGKIIEVSPKRSKVLLVTDPDSRLAGFVENGEGRAKGVLHGNFGSDMVLEKILHDEPIKEGDLVYSEGSEMEIPRGLVLGQVTQVNNIDNQVFKDAVIKPVFDVSNLDLVFVIVE